MATKTKTKTPLEDAQALVADLEAKEAAARENADKARTHLADLQTRNQSGDASVSGLAIVTARADVEAAQGIQAHAAKVLSEAKAQATLALADEIAGNVRESLNVHDMNATVEDAISALSRAMAVVQEAVRSMDSESDRAGQALFDAGIPEGQWTNGVRWFHVRNIEASIKTGNGPVRYQGTIFPGRFNVEVQTAEGTAWVSSRNRTRDSRGVVDGVLDKAWAVVKGLN